MRIADPDAATELWQRVVRQFGGVDVLINNAGVYIMYAPLDTSYESWHRCGGSTLGANLLAPANLSLLAAQSMAGRVDPVDAAFGRGRIVHISSRGAFRGEPVAPADPREQGRPQCPIPVPRAKALAPRAIYVYCIAPGWVETVMAASHLSGPDGPAILAQHPLGRVNRTDEVAAAAVYCALDAPPAMTGGVIDVNGASYLRTRRLRPPNPILGIVHHHPTSDLTIMGIITFSNSRFQRSPS